MGVFRRRDWIVWRKVSCDFYFLASFCYFFLGFSAYACVYVMNGFNSVFKLTNPKI